MRFENSRESSAADERHGKTNGNFSISRSEYAKTFLNYGDGLKPLCRLVVDEGSSRRMGSEAARGS